MKKVFGFPLILIGVLGVGVLLLSGALHMSILTIIGLVLVALGVIGGIVSNAIERPTDKPLWYTRPEEGLRKPLADKGQLPLGGYIHGPR